jgi:hypothetical protein
MSGADHKCRRTPVGLKEQLLEEQLMIGWDADLAAMQKEMLSFSGLELVEELIMANHLLTWFSSGSLPALGRVQVRVPSHQQPTDAQGRNRSAQSSIFFAGSLCPCGSSRELASPRPQ